jgi:phosphohistidine phosphatase
MKLYLVQHGEAAPKSEDPVRPLTARGQDDVARVAAFVRQAGAEVSQIRHSGKRRAEETACILAEYLEPSEGIAALPGMAPKDDVRPVAELLSRQSKSLMFVGHRMFMDRLVALLVTGNPDSRVVRFRRGAMACLVRKPKSRKWFVHWFVVPELVP